METKELEKVLTELKGVEGRIMPILQAAQEEQKKWGATTDATGKRQDDLEKKHDALEVELKDMVESLKKLETFAARPDLLNPRGDEKSLSYGERFVQSEQFKVWQEHKGSMPMAPVPIGPVFGKKEITSGADSLRLIYATERVQQIFANPVRPERVRDLLPIISTTANVIDFVRETGYVINAAMVAEAAAKPESDISFDDLQVAVRTLAHWIPVNRQLLADIPALAQYLNLRLTEGLKLVEDTQILYGDGLGQNLTGILTDPDIQEYLWSSSGIGSDTKIDAVRRAITLAQLAYYPVTGIVMNPIDWQDIELVKNTEGLYVWTNVASGSDPVLWKARVIPTAAINDGEALLGAFAQGAAVWDREESNIRVSEHHSDFFTKNRVAVLCEERLAVTVFRPESFVRVEFDHAPGS